jgi:hypothetical protein
MINILTMYRYHVMINIITIIIIIIIYYECPG